MTTAIRKPGSQYPENFPLDRERHPDAVEKIQALLPAIEKAMPPLLVARMRSHSSAYFRELVETRERLVRDADDFVAVAIAGFNQMNRGGPAGNAVAVH